MKKSGLIIAVIPFILLFMASSGFALDVRRGKTILISSGEVIDEDLYIGGDTVIIEGTVNGDLWAVGKDITVSGDVMGSINCISGSTTLLGNVKNGVKVIGGKLIVEGIIGHDIFFLGNEINLKKNGLIGGDLYFGAKEVLIEGPVSGNIKGGGRTVIISSRIGEDAHLWLKWLTLSSKASIGGKLTYTSDVEAYIQSGAEVQGAITHHIPEYREKLKNIFPFVIVVSVIAKILAFIMTVLVGLVFVLVMPGWILSLSEAIKQKPGLAAGWGAIILIAVPIGALIAFGTVFGIALGAFALSAYYIILYTGYIAISLCIGTLILGHITKVEKKGIIFGSFVLGLFLITLLRFIPVFGHIVWFAASIFGVGSIVASLIIRKAKSGITA